jgi:histidine triad (HIT) family protein
MTDLFCAIAAGAQPAHIVLDTPEVIGFLDIRPVFKGHVLLAPRTHVETLVELPDELLAPFFRASRSVAATVRTAYGAQGSFVAINNVVSQSVPHLHVHVVPRTKGDGLRGFFWPRTKYADEAEAESYAERLRKALAELEAAPDSMR